MLVSADPSELATTPATSLGQRWVTRPAAPSWLSGITFLLSHPHSPRGCMTPSWGTGLQGSSTAYLPQAQVHCRQQRYSRSCHTQWWTRPCQASSPSPVIHRSMGKTQKSVTQFCGRIGVCHHSCYYGSLPSSCRHTVHLHDTRSQSDLLLWQGGYLLRGLAALMPAHHSTEAVPYKWFESDRVVMHQIAKDTTFIPGSSLLGIYSK